MDKKISSLIKDYKMHDIKDTGVKTSNMVVNVHLIGEGPIDLEKIARTCPEVEFNADEFAAAIVRAQPPNSCGLLFAIRKNIVSGVRTKNQTQYIISKYSSLIEQNGFDVQKIVYKIMNRVICFETKYLISIKRFSKESPYNTTYEEDLFPGCSIELDEEWGVKKAIVFSSGKINCIGATSEANAKKTFDMLESKLQNYKMTPEEEEEYWKTNHKKTDHQNSKSDEQIDLKKQSKRKPTSKKNITEETASKTNIKETNGATNSEKLLSKKRKSKEIIIEKTNSVSVSFEDEDDTADKKQNTSVTIEEFLNNDKSTEKENKKIKLYENKTNNKNNESLLIETQISTNDIVNKEKSENILEQNDIIDNQEIDFSKIVDMLVSIYYYY